MGTEQQRQAGPWVLEREIGSGSFAKVWQATHQQTRQVAAVKEINLEKLSKKLQESLASEVAVLKHTQHQNIVCLLDLIRDANRLYLVLEYCSGGDLGHYIRRYRQASEPTARYFLRQLAEGLKELRRHNVIHRDLKPQNLLLGDTSCQPLLKIADFGFARSLGPQGLAETLCGSPLYMAPEILQAQKYDAKADLWSIGTILYELLVGRPPYNGANHIQLLRNIERAEARLPDHVAARLSPDARGLLAGLLRRNPLERLSFEEFFAHPFLAAAADAGRPGGGVQPGASMGVPPPMPPGAPAAAAGPAPPALPPAVRQAAAAAAAAAAGDSRGASAAHQQHHRAAAGAGGPADSSSVARPQLHLTGVSHPASAAAVPRDTLTQQQQQQQQPTHAHGAWQHQQQQAPSLVPRPVSQHPLAGEPAPRGPSSAASSGPRHTCEGEADGGGALMADSLEGDFVVVFTPRASTAGSAGGGGGSGAPRSSAATSNTSSKASSGLADPKAAAVLQGGATPPVGLRAPGGWHAGALSPQQQQHAQAPLAGPRDAAGLPSTHLYYQQQQQLQQQHGAGPPVVARVLSVGGEPAGATGHPQLPFGLGGAAPSAQQPLAPQAGGGHGGASMQLSMLAAPASPLQLVQLLVQVVRACVCLLAQHQDGGAAGGPVRGGTTCTTPPVLQQGEQVALLLVALQLVQVLCCPQQQQHQQAPAGATAQQEQQGAARREEDADADSLAAVLAAASQSDVEQLMSAAVDLIRLADTHTQGLAGGAGPHDASHHHEQLQQEEEEEQQQQQQEGPDDGGSGAAQAAAAAGPGSSGCWAGGAAQRAASGLLAARGAPLPDPAAVLYRAALDGCKGAAVDEAMGNWAAAVAGYSLAADLLLFLAQDWGRHLAAPADPGLPPHERAALHRLYAAVSARLAAVVGAAPPSALLC